MPSVSAFPTSYQGTEGGARILNDDGQNGSIDMDETGPGFLTGYTFPTLPSNAVISKLDLEIESESLTGTTIYPQIAVSHDNWESVDPLSTLNWGTAHMFTVTKIHSTQTLTISTTTTPAGTDWDIQKLIGSDGSDDFSIALQFLPTVPTTTWGIWYVKATFTYTIPGILKLLEGKIQLLEGKIST